METSVTLLLQLFVQLSLVNGWYDTTERVEQYGYIPCPLLGAVTHAKIVHVSPPFPSLCQKESNTKYDTNGT